MKDITKELHRFKRSRHFQANSRKFFFLLRNSYISLTGKIVLHEHVPCLKITHITPFFKNGTSRKKKRRNRRVLNKTRIHLKPSDTIRNYMKPIITTKLPKQPKATYLTI